MPLTLNIHFFAGKEFEQLPINLWELSTSADNTDQKVIENWLIFYRENKHEFLKSVRQQNKPEEMRRSQLPIPLQEDAQLIFSSSKTTVETLE